jgi:hypothetical protein
MSELEVVARKPTLLEVQQVVGHIVLLKYRVSCGGSQGNRNNKRENRDLTRVVVYANTISVACSRLTWLSSC